MFLKTSHVLSNFAKTLSPDRRKTGLLCVSRLQQFSSEDSNTTTKTFNFGSRFTLEQQILLLDKINTSSTDELKKYSITESRIRKLTSYREKNGSFKSLDEIFLMQGIEINVLEKFCQSMLKSESPSKFRSINFKSDILTPALNEDVRTALSTYTGIWVCGSIISWAQVDSGCNLLKWECRSLGDVSMKDGLVAAVESVANIITNVPSSHAYIMETDPIIPLARMNSATYYLQQQRQQIVVAIVALLGRRESRFAGTNESNTLINNIYMMRSRTPARLFDLLIGSEIVASGQVVEQIIGMKENSEENVINIIADKAMKEYYKSHDIYEREQMNWALLLTSAFISLSVLKTSTLKRTKGKRN